MTYVDIIKKWKEKKIDSIEKLDQQLSNFRIIFAYNSGAIENSQITYHETKDQYYKALDHYDNTGDITPFLNYMKKSLEKTWVLGQRQSPKNTLQDLHLEQ